jgi:hypothetical protein
VIALPYVVMVGLGPTIHEFLSGTVLMAGELMDGRAKHDHDGIENDLEPGSIHLQLVRLDNGSRITPLARLSGMMRRMDTLMREKPAAIVSRETRKSMTP